MEAAGREQLLAALNELLEAERAGARVMLHTAREVDEALRPLARDIQHDEAHWCDVLGHAIQALQGTASRHTGAFYEKAMAIGEARARLALVNRGQDWVVRRLDALLPLVTDATLREPLEAMREAHRRNIQRVAAQLETEPGSPAR